MSKLLFRVLIIFITLLLSWPITAIAGIEEKVIDRVNDVNDVSSLEIKPKGTWLPVPIPVSNPTIGTGLQAAILYLHPEKSANSATPNSTSGIVGMYTNTDSWMAGGFHDGNWKDDLYRFRVLAGTGEFNLDFFGIGDDPLLADNPLKYNLASDILYTQFLRRLPGSEDWYLGIRYIFTDANVTFKLDSLDPRLPQISEDMKTSSLGLMSAYDSRDNNYYPTEGTNFEFIWLRDDNKWGSDFEFDKIITRYNTYLPLTSNDVLAFRADFASADEGTPFYLLPTLKMRGFPMGRYKDKNSLSGHAEWRHKFKPRWGFILFYEIGSIATSASDLFRNEIITSIGGGIRWQVTKDKKLNLGIDAGYSGGDKAIYVQVGEKF